MIPIARSPELFRRRARIGCGRSSAPAPRCTMSVPPRRQQAPGRLSESEERDDQENGCSWDVQYWTATLWSGGGGGDFTGVARASGGGGKDVGGGACSPDSADVCYPGWRDGNLRCYA